MCREIVRFILERPAVAIFRFVPAFAFLKSRTQVGQKNLAGCALERDCLLNEFDCFSVPFELVAH